MAIYPKLRSNLHSISEQFSALGIRYRLDMETEQHHVVPSNDPNMVDCRLWLALRVAEAVEV